MARRISNFAENNKLFPDFQFGFRKSHSTVAAATLLFEAANSRLNAQPKSLKTFVCFIDFAKCFDSIRRDILFVKLQRLGFPPSLCSILHFIFKNTKFFIRSGTPCRILRVLHRPTTRLLPFPYPFLPLRRRPSWMSPTRRSFMWIVLPEVPSIRGWFGPHRRICHRATSINRCTWEILRRKFPQHQRRQDKNSHLP